MSKTFLTLKISSSSNFLFDSISLSSIINGNNIFSYSMKTSPNNSKLPSIKKQSTNLIENLIENLQSNVKSDIILSHNLLQKFCDKMNYKLTG